MSKRLYSTLLPDALQFAAELHKTQSRKGPIQIPYLAHLLAVTAKVLEYGGDETTAIAAVLHDSIEDRPKDGETAKNIERMFGKEILDIIMELTHAPYDETKTPNEHVDMYVKHMENMTPRALLIAICDKQHNAQSMINEYINTNKLGDYKGGPKGVMYKYSKIANKAHEICYQSKFEAMKPAAIDLMVISGNLAHLLNDHV